MKHATLAAYYAKRDYRPSRHDSRVALQASAAAVQAVEPPNYELRCGDVLEQLDRAAGERYQLVVSSPPYNIGKEYERDSSRTLDEYIEWHRQILKRIFNLVEPDGNVCWQLGSFVRDGAYLPLDIALYPVFAELGFKLRNRIIWRFNFGLNAEHRLSGRYETLLWFTKGDKYKFNLNPIRVPQLYPGKRHPATKAGEKAGKPSGNPLGKNPSDFWEFSADKHFVENPVWDLPNVKAKHPERTAHTCQFPIELAERCILAFSDEGDAILDPFVGSGTSIIAALKHRRYAVGIDRDASFLDIASERLRAFEDQTLSMRPSGKEVRRPRLGEKVATIPAEWLAAKEGGED